MNTLILLLVAQIPSHDAAVGDRQAPARPPVIIELPSLPVEKLIIEEPLPDELFVPAPRRAVEKVRHPVARPAVMQTQGLPEPASRDDIKRLEQKIDSISRDVTAIKLSARSEPPPAEEKKVAAAAPQRWQCIDSAGYVHYGYDRDELAERVTRQNRLLAEQTRTVTYTAPMYYAAPPMEFHGGGFSMPFFSGGFLGGGCAGGSCR